MNALYLPALLLPALLALSSHAAAAGAEAGSAEPQPAEADPAEDESLSRSAAYSEEDEVDTLAPAAEPTREDEATAGDDASDRDDALEAPSDSESKDDERDARRAFQLGDKAYYEGDYEVAVKEFETAYALSGRVEMLFNLANAHERLGNHAEAGVALRGYIPHAPAEDRPALERRLSRLEARAESDQQSASLGGDSTNANDAEERATVPVTRALGIGLVSFGGMALVAGTGFAISAGQARKQLDEECVQGSSGRLCPESASSALDQDKTHSMIADISFAVGAVAAATGTYLIIVSRDTGERVTAEIGPGTLFLRGRF